MASSLPDSQTKDARHDFIKVVYPTVGHTIYEASTFLIGSLADASKDNQLQLVTATGESDGGDSEKIDFSESGYFSHPINLAPGDNTVTLQLLDATSIPLSESFSLDIHRFAPLTVLPESPVSYHVETVLPNANYTLMPGDSLKVAISASSNCQVLVSLPGVLSGSLTLSTDEHAKADQVIDNREKIFQEWHQTNPVIPKQGYYQAELVIPETANPIEQAEIIFQIQNAYQETLTVKAPGKLTIQTQFQMAKVMTHLAPVWQESEQFSRYSPQAERTVVRVTGQVEKSNTERLYRIQVDAHTTGWMRAEDLSFLEADKLLEAEAPASLTSLELSERDNETLELRLGLSQCFPIQWHCDGDRLELRLSRLTLSETFSEQVASLKSNPPPYWLKPVALDLGQFSDSVLIALIPPELSAEPSKISGLTYHYQEDVQGKQLVITCRRLPKDTSKVRVLIDPGHGGAELGAIAPDGLPEKDLNLAVSKLLYEQLSKQGFQCQLTRADDSQVSLADRVKQANGFNAHLCLSIHHNALPDGRNPKKYQGACSFYYYDFSKALAEKLQQAMVSAGQYDFGVFHESFYMTRIHQCMSVLLEVGFFTYPDDYEKLISPSFQKKLVNEWVEKLKAYVLA